MKHYYANKTATFIQFKEVISPQVLLQPFHYQLVSGLTCLRPGHDAVRHLISQLSEKTRAWRFYETQMLVLGFLNQTFERDALNGFEGTAFLVKTEFYVQLKIH